jgi:hypothetical protein
VQLDEHIGIPVIEEQSPKGGVQLLVQLPHVVGRVRSVSQPSLGFAVQCPKPLAQAEGWIMQAPETHWTAGDTDPARTWGRVLQSNPQAPQFLASVCVLTHLASQRFGVGAVQLGTQVKGVVEVEHAGAVEGHGLVQLPHVRGSVRFASHPSSG